MTLWQYADLDKPAKLPPCAYEVIFDVRPSDSSDGSDDGKLILDCILNQRSSDFLVAGMGINQMQYVALQMMFAKHLGMVAGKFVWRPTNLHIYDRHIEQAKEIINRFENYSDYFSQTPEIDFYCKAEDKTNFYDIKPDDFVLEGYSGIEPQLKFPLAI
jgi:thymidylate synthase